MPLLFPLMLWFESGNLSRVKVYINLPEGILMHAEFLPNIISLVSDNRCGVENNSLEASPCCTAIEPFRKHAVDTITPVTTSK